jgi:hypothetical protein
MEINTSKTAFQSFSLAHKTIHPRLRYKDAALSQSNESKYLGVTFDNKLNWKNHVDKFASRVSKRITVMKRHLKNLTLFLKKKPINMSCHVIELIRKF